MELITMYYHYCAYCKKSWTVLEITSICNSCNRTTIGGPTLNCISKCE